MEWMETCSFWGKFLFVCLFFFQKTLQSVWTSCFRKPQASGSNEDGGFLLGVRDSRALTPTPYPSPSPELTSPSSPPPQPAAHLLARRVFTR